VQLLPMKVLIQSVYLKYLVMTICVKCINTFIPLASTKKKDIFCQNTFPLSLFYYFRYVIHRLALYVRDQSLIRFINVKQLKGCVPEYRNISGRECR
jgi:hypothetical protein